MKRQISVLFFTIAFFLIAPPSYSQALPPLLLPSTRLGHFQLQVTQNTTTVLVFPAPIKPIDRGSRDLLAQKQPGIDNVLKLKAARKDFPETNLHVFTADGRIYAFDVSYTDSLAQTYDLRQLPPVQPIEPNRPLLFSDQVIDAATLNSYIQKLQNESHPSHGPSRRYACMRIRLTKVALGGPLLFFRFDLSNLSSLDYPVDFIRLFIRDRQKAKRTSVQEQEMTPVYQDSISIIAGGNHITHIIAVPAFTLAGGKEFIVEVHEKNGGRSLLLHLRNKNLLAAQKL